ncbi:MAG: DUF1549 domain-containing protein [Planctomycetaceae bacterium]
MQRRSARGWGLSVMIGMAAVVAAIPAGTQPAFAQKRKQRNRKTSKKPARPKLPPLRTAEDKRRFLEAIRRQMPTIRIGRKLRFTSDDLDRSLELSIGLPRSGYAPLVNDETFLRRVSQDLTGELPDVKQIRAFVRDTDKRKRSKLIDRLLASKAYARKWAKYWRDVIFHVSTANRRRVNPGALENWFATQFEQNTPWDRITAELVSAMPQRKRGKGKKNRNNYGQNEGQNNFILAYENKPVEVASQTARIFMGISIQCAQCHDHPFDRWKREQFHELAAFFARGKYYMTDRDDPAKKTEMKARFLLGETPPAGLDANGRRVAVAAYLIYNPGNYWFARAYVNRIWNELIGDGFYAVDSLGPDSEVVHKLVVNRLAAVFRYRGFDVKWVFRTIMNSRAYQRDIRTIRKDEDLFTAVRPSRLRPDQVVASVKAVTGSVRGLDRNLARIFKINPSVPQRDMEGSIQQALLLMNNRALQPRLKNGPLKRRLAAIRDNERMIEELYLGVLARTPRSAETQRGLRFLKRVKNRTEAIEDLIWVLVNSTEFITKR